MTNEELKRDAARYWRLRVLGCAPCETKQLENGTVLRFSNLDEFIDHDIKIRPSRGEAEVYENKTEGAAVSASPQPRCPKCGSGKLVFRHVDGSANRTCAFVAVQCPQCQPEGTIYLDSPAEMSQFFAAAPAQEPQTSRTYGDLPGSIRNMVEPHEWDNKNISEQRDYALDMVDFLERELGNFRRNQAAAQEPPVEDSPQGSLKDFSVAKTLEGFSKEPPQPTVFSPQKGKP